MSNGFTYQPPCDEETLHRLYVVDGLSQSEVGALLGTSQKVIWRALKKMGVQCRPPVARNQAGSANNNWRGGRVLNAIAAKREGIGDRGYWYVYAPDHPNATKGGYVAEHTKVATAVAGRALVPGEHVHHINLQKRDNRPENLAITTRKQHGRWHAQLEQIAASLLEAGLVDFDPASGYRLRGVR